MNKLGKSSTTTTLLVVLLVAVLLVAVFMVAKNVQFGKKEITPGACQESTAPIAWSSQNALNLAYSVPGISYEVQTNEGASAPNGSQYAVADKLHYLASASGYVATINDFQVPCGGGTINTKISEVTQPKVDVFNSNNLITDNVATNQSAIADGASATMAIRLTGVNKKTTGDMVVLLEANTSVDTLTLGGAAAGSQKPDFYATQVASNSKTFSFDVPAIVGAISKNYDLVLTMKDTSHYCGPVYYTIYAKQGFEDTDGSYKVGIQDKNGVDESAEVTSGSFVINCA